MYLYRYQAQTTKAPYLEKIKKLFNFFKDK